MGLIDRMRAAVHVFSAPQAKTSGTAAAWNALFTTGMDAWILSQGKMVQPFTQHPTVFAAVSAISAGIAALPLEMFPESDKKREKPLPKSMVKELLDTPGPDMDGPQLIEETLDDMLLHGEAFWFMDGFARRTGAGTQYPTSLELWEPWNVRHVVVNGKITAWEYQDGADIFRTPAATVIQFKCVNPYSKYRGLAPMTAAMIAAQGGYKALNFQDAFFENSTVLGGLITPKEGAIIQPEAMLRLRDEIETRHQGSAKRGRLGAVNAPVDFVQFGEGHKDMDFPEWLDASSALILMVFKVPPSVAGLQKDANYSSSVQQAKQFWYNHLPTAEYIQRRIKARLCKAFGIPEAPYFKTESIKAMTEDQESVSNRARNYWNMGVPFDQINDRLELGFDAKAHVSMETPWVTFSQVNADEQATAAGMSDVGGPTRGPRPGDGQNQPGDPSTVANDPTQGKRLHLVKDMDPREFHRAMNWKTLISRVYEEERAYQYQIGVHFDSLERVVLANLRQPKKSDVVINIDQVLWDKQKAKKDLEKKTDPIYRSAILKGGESVARELSLDVSFDFLSPEVQSFLQEKHFELADLIDAPTEERLREALQEAIREGENLEKVADRVETVFDVERSRARRIARTEVAEAFNGGRFETMKEAGVEKLEWLSARDNRVRDSHIEVDGEIVTLGDRFSNGLLYPLDPAGPPEEIVNCRCVSLPAA